MYRDDEAALRDELEALEGEIRSARKEHEELLERCRQVRAGEQRLQRLAHPRWSLLIAGAGFLALAVAAHWRTLTGESPAAARQLDPEVERLRSELARALSEGRGVLEEIREARINGGKDPRMVGVLAAMRTLDARDEKEAWQIVAGAACIRGDSALLDRARDHSPDAGATPVFHACDALGGRAP